MVHHGYTDRLVPITFLDLRDVDWAVAELTRMRDAGMAYAVVESTSHGLALHRLNHVEYDVGVFTNLTQDHLDYHRSMDEYARAKARLFAGLGRDAIAFIAYPKAGQLGTDLNRDILWKHVAKEGLRGVRQVSLDHVWSAMRFRPA